MDDIALNPDAYQLFGEPALLILTAVWLLCIFMLRFLRPHAADMVLYAGALLIVLATARPVFSYVVSEVPVLLSETRAVLNAGSADPLRERDPLFGLIELYRESNPGHPLVVLTDDEGEALRWAAYYLYPRPVVRSTAEHLATAVPGADEPARFVLTRGAPALPADAEVTVVGRVNEWLLFKVRQSPEP